MAVVAHFQCSKWLNLKSFRILYFPTTLFNKSICDSCKRNGKADEREKKKIYNTPSEFIIAHIFYIFRENEIFEFLSAFRLHSILQQQKSQKCVRVCVCDRRKLKKPVEKSAPHPNAYANEKSKEKKTKRKFKCEMWEENGSEQESAREKHIGGMKSDSFFSEMKKKKQL